MQYIAEALKMNGRNHSCVMPSAFVNLPGPFVRFRGSFMLLRLYIKVIAHYMVEWLESRQIQAFRDGPLTTLTSV